MIMMAELLLRHMLFGISTKSAWVHPGTVSISPLPILSSQEEKLTNLSRSVLLPQVEHLSLAWVNRITLPVVWRDSFGCLALHRQFFSVRFQVKNCGQSQYTIPLYFLKYALSLVEVLRWNSGCESSELKIMFLNWQTFHCRVSLLIKILTRLILCFFILVICMLIKISLFTLSVR